MSKCDREMCDYYGLVEQDNLCSFCFYDKYPNKRISVPPNWSELNISIETTNQWLTDSICLITKYSGECIICCEDNKHLAKKFCCVCEPNVCISCISKLNTCPTCRANKYYQLDKLKILFLIKLMNYDDHHLRKNIYTFLTKQIIDFKISSGTISLRNFTAKVDDIIDCIKIYQRLENRDCNEDEIYNIFSFAIDPWNMDRALKENDINDYDGCLSFRRTVTDYKKLLGRRFFDHRLLNKAKIVID